MIIVHMSDKKHFQFRHMANKKVLRQNSYQKSKFEIDITNHSIHEYLSTVVIIQALTYHSDSST